LNFNSRLNYNWLFNYGYACTSLVTKMRDIAEMSRLLPMLE